ncbi:U box domain-containing protein [Heterostelium album PN500]|uniref:Poly [ADP-ribose] polymerase n=1 Tax=Heterostelium pallidum (strain ATCC 26659 / Pp 5 / PN500) TaxID=670386 RepID=D3BVM8_HETP5|nr:U box domain-containing protein [Heterostelium album PN500]EFA74531.1 U box domain-containing protein [Heterostelium album PN500]|eukprot:XP_020426665.1 U box domain-containing protein [Heterostelium album PN500]
MRLEVVSAPIIVFDDYRVSNFSTKIQITTSKLSTGVSIEKLSQVIKLMTDLDLQDAKLDGETNTINFNLNSPSEFDMLTDTPIKILNQIISFEILKDKTKVYIFENSNGVNLVLSEYDVNLSSNFDDITVTSEEQKEIEIPGVNIKLTVKSAFCSNPNKGMTITYRITQPGVLASTLRETLVCITRTEEFQIMPLDETCGFITFKSQPIKLSILTNNKEITLQVPLNQNTQPLSKPSTTPTSTATTSPSASSIPKPATAKQSKTPAATTTTTTTTTTPQVVNNKKPKKDRFVATSIIPKNISPSDLTKILTESKYKVKFIIIRAKVAYVELDKESHERIRSDKTIMTKDGFKFSFKKFGGEIPAIKAYLFPYKEGINLWDVGNTIEKLINAPTGKIRYEKSHLIIPFSSLEEKKQLLDLRSINIKCGNFRADATKDERKKRHMHQLWVFDKEDQTRRIASRLVEVPELKVKLLEGSMKRLLEQINTQFNVSIEMEKNGANCSLKLSSPLDNINEAQEQLKQKINDIKEINYFFRVDTDIKKNLLSPMIRSIFKELPNSKSINYSISEKKGKEAWSINITFSGADNEVMEIQRLLKEVEVEEHELPPKELVLIPESVRQEFSVSLHLGEKSMIICGGLKNLTNFKQWIQSNLKKDTRVEMEMSQAELFFFQFLIKSDFHDVVVTETKNGLIINGDEKKVKEAQDHVLKMKKSIEEVNFSKSFAKNLMTEISPFLKDYFKDDIVYTRFDNPFAKKPRPRRTTTTTTTTTTSSSSSSSSSDISSDEDSNDEYSEDEEQFKEEYGDVKFQLFIHRERDYENLKKKIVELKYMNEGRAYEFNSVSIEEQRFILKFFGDKYSNRITIFQRQKMVVVQGLWQSDVKKLVSEIQSKRASFTTTERHVIEGDQFKFQYLTATDKRLMKIQNEFDVKLKYDTKDQSIIYNGQHTNIKLAKKHIKSIVKGLKMERYDISSYLLSINRLVELRKELNEKFDVEMAYTETRDHIIVIGQSLSTSWGEIKGLLDSLVPVEEIWPSMEDEPIKNHMDFEESFLESNNILKIKYLKDQKRFMVFCKNQAEMDDAIESLNDMIKNQVKFTKRMDVRSNYHWILVTRFELAQFKQLQSKHPKVKFTEKDKSIQMSGVKEDVLPAYDDLHQWLSKLVLGITTVRQSIPNPVALELLKPTFYTYFLDKYKMLIQQNVDSNETLISKKVSETIFEVNRGDILLEKTDCIVNAANEQLQHYGGIASQIAEAAGPEFRKQCSDWVQKNGPVLTGKAMATAPGRLDFKLVIHAVAPIWDSKKVSVCQDLLKKAIDSSLKLAVQNKCFTISIPAIGSGIYGVPKLTSAKCIIDSTLNFIKENPGKIYKIIFCDRDDEVLKHLYEYLDKKTTSILTNIIQLFSKSETTENKAVGITKGSTESSTSTSTTSTTSTSTTTSKAEPFKYSNATFDPMYQWKWQENDGSFISFDPDQNYQIEIAFLKKEKKLEVQGDLNMQKNGEKYLIDLVNMTEMNTKYMRNLRPIKRTLMNAKKQYGWYYLSAGGQKVYLQDIGNQIGLAFERSMKIRINNPDATINFPESTISLYVNNRITNTFRLHQRSYEESFNDYVEATKPTQRTMEVGNNEDSTVSEMEPTQTILISCPNEESSKRCVEYLKTEIESNYHEKRIVQITSAQYQRLQSELNKIATNHHCKIKESKDIEKIQNNLLWEKYSTRRDQMVKKINPKMKKQEIESHEMMLFHGTRNNGPELIYNDEDGFESRYSATGMWGLATYFAKKASYSHEYAYRNPRTGYPGQQPYRQMFLARVLIGDCIHLMPNQPNLKKPPKKEQTKEYSEYFDTVSGETQGSYVYMVYENNRAYPEYLITYLSDK